MSGKVIEMIYSTTRHDVTLKWLPILFVRRLIQSKNRSVVCELEVLQHCLIEQISYGWGEIRRILSRAVAVQYFAVTVTVTSVVIG
jgi:hypothetical protein